MEVENVPERDKSDYGLIIACYAELQFVGFDELGGGYWDIPKLRRNGK